MPDLRDQEHDTETETYSGWHSPFDQGAARPPRQPHAGSTLLLLGIFALTLAVVGAITVALSRKLHLVAAADLTPYGNPRLSIIIELIAYLLTAALAYPVLRTFWQRPVAAVLQMNWPAARRRAIPLVFFGLVLAALAQLAASRMSMPKDMPINKFFHHSTDVWLMAIFGTFIAPLAEEIVFRGFLLKTFAIAFDWTRKNFGQQEERFWVQTDETSQPAWIFGAVLSSALFAAMHAAQLGWAWNAVSVLSVVGLVLAFVRIRMRSVWASSLIHMGYNGFLFLIVFFVTDGFRHLDKLQS